MRQKFKKSLLLNLESEYFELLEYLKGYTKRENMTFLIKICILNLAKMYAFRDPNELKQKEIIVKVNKILDEIGYRHR